MKVVRLADAFEYPVTGHFDMRALRLHNKETSNTVDYTLGLSHFLPGGGTEYVETGEVGGGQAVLGRQPS